MLLQCGSSNYRGREFHDATKQESGIDRTWVTHATTDVDVLEFRPRYVKLPGRAGCVPGAISTDR
jgi:hypothetical protein